MTSHAGGTKVESGYYLNTRSMAVAGLPAEGLLPGTEKDRFVKVPWPVLLLAAPVVGGLFVIAYPLVGFSLMAWGLGKKVARVAGEAARGLAAALAPAHAVGEAHLTGKPEGEPARGEPEIESLEKEIRERRKE